MTFGSHNSEEYALDLVQISTVVFAANCQKCARMLSFAARAFADVKPDSKLKKLYMTIYRPANPAEKDTKEKGEQVAILTAALQEVQE